MQRSIRTLPLAAVPLALPVAAHDVGALHLHASAMFVPLLVVAACVGLAAAVAPRVQRLRVRRREPRA